MTASLQSAEATGTKIISDRLLRVVACPVCKGPLTCDQEAGRLQCGACKLSYPVREGIPVLLVGEAVRQD